MDDVLLVLNVTKRLGGLPILRELMLTVKRGSVTALIGPNGAGKTTLLHLICGTLRPDGGQVFYDGKEITGRPPDFVARCGIGRLFQDVRIFPALSARQNVAIAALPFPAHRLWARRYQGRSARAVLRHADARAGEWLAQMGLSDRLDRPAGELSFGEQKLIGLARLFASRPAMIVLDEPTAGLSHGMVEHVTSLLREVAARQGLTVLLVEHNMRAVEQLADRVYFLHAGAIALSGTPAKVLEDRSVREVYLGL